MRFIPYIQRASRGIAFASAILLVGSAHAALSPPVVPGTFAALDALPPSPLVQRIQEALQGLGAYRGSVNGRLDEDTVAAIREYQRRAGLDDDGRVSDELLSHVEFTGRAIELGARLEAVKADQVRAAQIALQTRPETRALLEARPADERADLARDAAPCFAQPTVQCLLAEASESAKAIFDSRFRDWALGELVVAWSRAGLPDDAMRTAARIADPRLIIAALRDIAAATAEAGRLDQATAMVALIPDPVARARALAAVAFAHARTGAVPASVLAELESAARAMTAQAEPVAYLTDAAQTLLRLGATEAARQLVDVAAPLIGNAADPEGARSAVAAGLSATGRQTEALAMLEQISAPAQRGVYVALVRAHAAAGDVEAARDFAGKIAESRYRATALAEGAASAPGAESGNALLAAALDVATALEDRPSFARSHALRAVALSMAQLGGADDARALAGTIADPRLRAEARWSVASALAMGGDAAAASEVRALALADTRVLQSGLDRTWVLCGAVANDVAARDSAGAYAVFRLALEEAKSVTDPWGRTQALTRLAMALGVMR
jgi:peptidoglycan hydrolase-like protein with peptidoglycan-binding domain